jgi:hypothetical protein
VLFHRVFRDRELAPDLLVVHSPQQEAQYLGLPVGQRALA